MTRIFCVIILALLTAGEARSQSAELGLTVGVSAFNDNGIGSLRVFEEGLIPVSLRNGVRIGARWATNSWGFLGHEFSYAFQRTSLKIGGGPPDGMNVQNIYYNFVAHATPLDSSVRPFGTVGAGVSVYFPPGVSSLSGRGNKNFGYNYGGGVKFKLSYKFGLRFDVRDHVTGRPFDLDDSSGRFHNVEYSATFSLLF